MAQSDYVYDISVLHNGFAHEAHYFVDAGILHLKIDDIVWRSPVSADNIPGTARALLTEELLRRDWRLGLPKSQSEPSQSDQPNSGPTLTGTH